MLTDASSTIHGLSGRSGELDAVMRFDAQSLLYAAVLVFGALYLHRCGLRAGLAAALGALLAIGVAVVIGDLHYSARPFVAGHYTPLFSHSDDASFPSDHLCALGAVAAGAWFASRLLGAIAVILAVLVAFARVYAGVHWLGDVAAGLVIGAGSAVGVWYALAPCAGWIDAIGGWLEAHRLRPVVFGRGGTTAAGRRTSGVV